MVVALVSSPTAPIRPFLVLTLWPRSQKPRPSAAEIPITMVKVFRAVLLHEIEGDAGALEATEHCWIYSADHVFAVLDAHAEKGPEGRLKISAESFDALQTLKEAHMEVPDPTKRKRKRQTQGQRTAPGKNDVLNQKAAEKEEMAATKAISKKQKQKGLDTFEPVTAEDVRRSEAGRKSVRRLVKHIMDEEYMAFEGRSCFDEDGFCTVEGAQTLSRKAFLEKVPSFFEQKFWLFRNPKKYGEKVFGQLKDMLDKITGQPPSRTAWIDLIKDVAKVCDSGTVKVIVGK